MVSTIVRTVEFVTLLGAGNASIAQIQSALELAPILVAADGGGDTAIGHGLIPEAVIGDFDSLTENAANRIPGVRRHRLAEQTTTDFDKVLRSVDAPLSIGVGFTGARLDHTLAALHVLVKYPSRRCILLGDDDVIALLPPRVELSLAKGTRISLFPMGSVHVASKGLKWPTDGIDFTPAGAIGTSNEASGGQIDLLTSAPLMLLALPVLELQNIAKALVLSPTWPV